MKFVYSILLVLGTSSFGQKPGIRQENYKWGLGFDAAFSDKGGFVLAEGVAGLYVYNTASGSSKFYAKAFNGKMAPDENLLAFQKGRDSLVIFDRGETRLLHMDSVSNFLLLPRSKAALIQKVDGTLYYYPDVKTTPVILGASNKYILNQNGSKLYYSTIAVSQSDNRGYLLSYNFQNNRIDTILADYEIGDFKVNDNSGEVVVQVREKSAGSLTNDIVVIRPDKNRVSIRSLLKEQLEIIDQGIQLEKSTGRIFFKAVTKKEVRKVDPGELHTSMQVWNFQDPYLYPILANREEDSDHSFVYDPRKNTIIDFGENAVNYFPIKTGIDNKFIVGLTRTNIYEKHWQKSGRASCFLTNTYTGEVKEVYHQMEGYSAMPFQVVLDPNQKYLLYYDLTLRKYRVYAIASATEALLNKDPKLVLDNIDEDPSFTPSPYGIAGWSGDGNFVYVYGKYDVWKLDLTGAHSPLCVTLGTGAKTNRKLRIVDGGEDVFIRDDENLLLSCFDYGTKDNGFYELNIKKGMVRELLMDAHLYFNPGGGSQGKEPMRSLDKKLWLVERMSVGEYPNYFITKDFKKLRPVTDYQPQSGYNWMRSKLVKIGEGDNRIEGILYLPENFDSGKKYPLIIYLYETFTEGTHQYLFPSLSDGRLNIPWYVSNGYVVFLPDIKYRRNAPSESALRTVKVARDYFARQLFIDSSAIGLQGHSFGAYEVNYIVTHCGGFAAACAVSGASNLFTSFGNLRNSGNSGHINFEGGQYRIRKPLWEIPEVFLENSPIIHTDKVVTPLLLVSNKRDSTVLWSHAVEMFTALRRLGKPCWLLQYDHSKHAISDEDALDFSIRMQQYFDFYLKHKSQPDWMKGTTGLKERSLFPVIHD